MDGEAGWWTTSGKIGFPPLARDMGVGRQQQQPTSCIVQPVGVKLCTLGVFFFNGELGFLNCDGICMHVVNTHFEFLVFVFNSVYVDLMYNEISLTFTAASVRCVYCSHVVVLGLSVRLSQ